MLLKVVNGRNATYARPMEKLAGFQRKHLRGLAHELDPVVMIGKNGLTDAVLDAVTSSLSDHELIKLKFIDSKDEKDVIAADIAAKSQSELVGRIGNVAIFYRCHQDPKKRKIKVPQR